MPDEGFAGKSCRANRSTRRRGSFQIFCLLLFFRLPNSDSITLKFVATKKKVKNRGVAPDSFLQEILDWAFEEEESVFAPSSNKLGIYWYLEPLLGPFETPIERRAAMLEVMRVHAGFESSWDWTEGVDTTNKRSMANPESQETGIFQVSFDSTNLGQGALKPFVKEAGINSPTLFIQKMKTDHGLALSYYARLVRLNIRWAGPLLRHEVDDYLSDAAKNEFQSFLSDNISTAKGGVKVA
jgi:hypothetical protein